MNKKTIFYILGVVSLIAAAAMYFIGKDSGSLSELYDVWWIALPFAALFLFFSK